jgi:hypothetical protein
MLSLVLVIACKESTLNALPTEVSWGEIDFIQTPPDEGFEVQNITIKNTGETTVSAEIVSFNFDFLCLSGFTTTPADIGELEPDSEFILSVGVCGYAVEEGTGNLTTGSIDVDYDKETLSIPWSFTPVLTIPGQEDSGQ